ncbi:hypothetical protein DB42_AZ00460 [Neochlamydia sp. EPS4]|nr:hypothetical protein DB42_AZ00460 [Neochlamydia sp. EPS4]
MDAMKKFLRLIQVELLSYRLEGTVACSLLNKAELERSKGFFVLATNDMDVTAFPA